MAALGSLVVELAANTARLQSDMGKAVGIAQTGAKKLQSAFNFVGGGLLGGAVIGIAKQAIELGDSLNKAAKQAGVAGATISELAYVARQSDIDIQGLSGALQKMQVALSKASSGAAEQTRTLAALGLTIADIKGLAPDRQFELLGDRISKLRDPADRARAAVELFGDAGARLLPLFEQGAAGIRAAREEAVRIGAVLSDDTIASLSEADDAVKRLTQSWENFSATLVSKVAPGLSTVLDALSGQTKAQASLLAGFGAAAGNVDGLLLTFPQDSASKGPTSRRRGGASTPAPGFDRVVDDARKTAKRVAEAFELDPATLDRIAFEDWKRQTVENMDEVIRAGADMEDELSRYADEMAQSWIESTNTLSVYAETAARNAQSAFADWLFDPFENGIKGMLKGFVDILRRMVAEAAAAKIFEALGFGQKSGGGGGILDKLLGGLVGGGRNGVGGLRIPGTIPGFANGGSFEVGGDPGIDANLVAFRATRGERVTISKPGMGGGGVVIAPTYNIDARGATSELINALPEILRRRDASLREDIIEGLRRGRY